MNYDGGGVYFLPFAGASVTNLVLQAPVFEPPIGSTTGIVLTFRGRDDLHEFYIMQKDSTKLRGSWKASSSSAWTWSGPDALWTSTSP